MHVRIDDVRHPRRDPGLTTSAVVSGSRAARKRAQWLGVTMDPALLHAGMPPGVKQTLGSQSAVRAHVSKRTSATSARPLIAS